MSDRAATCPSCGVEIAGKVKKCPECGAVTFAENEMCPNCHATLERMGEEAGGQGNAPSAGLQDMGGEGGSPVPDEGKKPGKKSYMLIVVTVVILLIVGFVAYYMYDNAQRKNEQTAYEQAMKSSEPGELQNYLDMYVDAPSEHRDSVQSHLDLLMQADKEWTDVLVSGSKVAIERYLQLHPGSIHEMEGRLRIDSLDWMAAETAGTIEAYKAYMDAHADGAYMEEARARYDKLDAQQVSQADRQAVSETFGAFFKALGDNDDDALTATVANVMDDFLTKVGATKSDMLAYMHKKHNGERGTVEYRPNNDYKIEKQAAASGEGMECSVRFSVDEKKTDAEGKTTLTTLEVTAKVNADGKISTLRMKAL